MHELFGLGRGVESIATPRRELVIVNYRECGLPVRSLEPLRLGLPEERTASPRSKTKGARGRPVNPVGKTDLT